MLLSSHKATMLGVAALALWLTGCAGPRYHGQDYGGMGHRQMMAGPTAVAAVQPTAGNTVQGRVMFHQQGEQVWVHARVQGLKPNAEHGFHIHEKGDCSAADGTSAGGHFNPTGQPHGPRRGRGTRATCPTFAAMRAAGPTRGSACRAWASAAARPTSSGAD